MVYFINKILPCDIYNIIYDILLYGYINEIVTIKTCNIDIIISNNNKNKNIIKEQCNYIYKNIKSLYDEHIIKYNIHDRYISIYNLNVLNTLSKWCNCMINYINNTKQYNTKLNILRLSNSPNNLNHIDLSIINKLEFILDKISNNNFNIKKNNFYKNTKTFTLNVKTLTLNTQILTLNTQILTLNT